MFILAAPLRALVRWRTAFLLEQAEADAATLRYQRDVLIPQALVDLDTEKRELLRQFGAVADAAGAASIDMTPHLPAAPAPWAPGAPSRPCPLFHPARPSSK